jgi:DNA polymerase III delta subunit
LTDHLIARNRKRALQTLAKILDDGAEPLMLIGLIASNYHRLALAKGLMAQGKPKEEVFRLVLLPYSKRKNFSPPPAAANRANSRAASNWLRRQTSPSKLAANTTLACNSKCSSAN